MSPGEKGPGSPFRRAAPARRESLQQPPRRSTASPAAPVRPGRALRFGLAGLLCLAAALACAPGTARPPFLPASPAAESLGAAPTVLPRRPVPDCPRLDSRLFQLATADDPAAFAASAGLDYRDGAVLVVVELKEGEDLPPGHGAVVEARYASLVQARVPVGSLCALAKEASVTSVRPPAGVAPDAPRSPGGEGRG